MKQHRAAIILLSGWILMLPPLKKYEKEKHMVRRWQAAQTDAPLVQWKHEHSYNTAAACQVGRSKHLQDADATERAEQFKDAEQKVTDAFTSTEMQLYFARPWLLDDV